jgi:PKD repeat protein
MNARLRNLLLLVAAMVAVSACGGGGGDGSPNPPPNLAPLAAFSASPASGNAPLTVHFDASASSDTDGTITGYAWTFGDGSSATGPRVTSHLYSIAGSITVTLTVTDDCGASGSTSHQLTIVPPPNAPPVASFTVTPATGSVPLGVQFDGSASTDPDGSIVSYGWNFGDGATASGPKVASHVYTITGTFTVTLTVTDDLGATHWTTRQVSVSAVQPPIGVTLDAPTNGAVVPDAVSVVAAVWSTYAVREVTAEAGGSQVALTYNPKWVGPPDYTPTPRYVGTVSLAGRPVGPYTLTVRATDVQGTLAEVTANVTHDNPPVLTVAAPVNLSVSLGSAALGKVAFDARCTDDVPGCTVELRIDGQLHSNAPNVLIGSADLIPRVGAYVFEFDAIGGGSRGLTIEKRNVYVEVGARLSVVSQVEGAIRDADEQRLLSVESEEGKSDVLAIHDRVSGLTETIALPADRTVLTAYLIPGGALVEAELQSSSFLTPRLFLWREAALTELGDVVRGSSLAVNGRYATWISGVDLYRWDADEASPSVISDEAWTASVAADGTVAFGDSGFQIIRYRDGLQTTLTDGDPRYENSAPLTDGDNVVFRQRDLDAAIDAAAIVLIEGDTTIVLEKRDLDFWPSPGIDYQVRNGWVAFTDRFSQELLDVYTRSPDGSLLRHTSSSALCQFEWLSGVERLAGNGEVMMLCGMNQARWFSRGNGLVPVSASARGGRSYFLGGTWYVAIGSTFLAVDTSD